MEIASFIYASRVQFSVFSVECSVAVEAILLKIVAPQGAIHHYSLKTENSKLRILAVPAKRPGSNCRAGTAKIRPW
jgi:hypothetical protein